LNSAVLPQLGTPTSATRSGAACVAAAGLMASH
jgi:hypothetical protein